MRPVLVCSHGPEPVPNLLTRAMERAGLPVRDANLTRGDALPALDDVSAIVSFGGQMSVLDIAAYPFLEAERDLLRAAVAAVVPVFGICLGAQLLAAATGGRVFRLPSRYVEFPVLERQPGAAADAVFGSLPPSLRVVEWHEDAIEPPAAAVSLAETACAGCSVYRLGTSAWGTQIHLELDAQALAALMCVPSERDDLLAAGVDPARFLETGMSVLADQAPASTPVLEAFAQVVGQRERAG